MNGRNSFFPWVVAALAACTLSFAVWTDYPVDSEEAAAVTLSAQVMVDGPGGVPEYAGTTMADRGVVLPTLAARFHDLLVVHEKTVRIVSLLGLLLCVLPAVYALEFSRSAGRGPVAAIFLSSGGCFLAAGDIGAYTFPALAGGLAMVGLVRLSTGRDLTGAAICGLGLGAAVLVGGATPLTVAVGVSILARPRIPPSRLIFALTILGIVFLVWAIPAAAELGDLACAVRAVIPAIGPAPSGFADLPLLPVFFLPWLPFIFARHAASGEKERTARRIVVLWIPVSLAVFTVFGFPLRAAGLAALVPFAALAADGLARSGGFDNDKRGAKIPTRMLVLALPVFPLIAIRSAGLLESMGGEHNVIGGRIAFESFGTALADFTTHATAAAVAVFLVAGIFLLIGRRTGRFSPGVYALYWIIAFAPYATTYPRAKALASSPARFLGAVGEAVGEAPLATIGFRSALAAYYLRRQAIELAQEQARQIKSFRTGGRVSANATRLDAHDVDLIRARPVYARRKTLPTLHGGRLQDGTERRVIYLDNNGKIEKIWIEGTDAAKKRPFLIGSGEYVSRHLPMNTRPILEYGNWPGRPGDKIRFGELIIGQ